MSRVARGLPSLFLHLQKPPPTFQTVRAVQLQDGDRQERSEGVSELRTAVQDCGTKGKLFLAEKSMEFRSRDKTCLMKGDLRVPTTQVEDRTGELLRIECASIPLLSALEI